MTFLRVKLSVKPEKTHADQSRAEILEPGEQSMETTNISPSLTIAELEEVTHYPAVRRSNRISKPPEPFGGAVTVRSRMGSSSDETLDTYAENMNSNESIQWYQAMCEELKDVQRRKTWILMRCPIGIKPISNKWVYLKTRDANNNWIRHKARLFPKRYSQRHGIDYAEVFSPVA